MILNLMTLYEEDKDNDFYSIYKNVSEIFLC